jgi:hypothetical protein
MHPMELLDLAIAGKQLNPQDPTSKSESKT